MPINIYDFDDFCWRAFESYLGVIVKLERSWQGACNDLARMSHGCHKEVARTLQGCRIEVARRSQGCEHTVPIKNQVGSCKKVPLRVSTSNVEAILEKIEAGRQGEGGASAHCREVA